MSPPRVPIMDRLRLGDLLQLRLKHPLVVIALQLACFLDEAAGPFGVGNRALAGGHARFSNAPIVYYAR